MRPYLRVVKWLTNVTPGTCLALHLPLHQWVWPVLPRDAIALQTECRRLGVAQALSDDQRLEDP